MSIHPQRFSRVEVYGPGERVEGECQLHYHHARFWWADYHPGAPAGEHEWRERCQHFFSPLPDQSEVQQPIEKKW